MSLPHCPAAERIIAKQGDTIVIRNGEPTDLNWHISSCAACEYLQDESDEALKQLSNKENENV